jgi:hypothetical protein
LGYVIGKENRDKGLLKYFDMWKFKHPTDDDFIHVMELQSGMVLDWYNEYFVRSTKTIDYSISAFSGGDKNSTVVLQRKGLMPMPVEVEVTLKNGNRHMYYMPLDLMRGEKSGADYNGQSWNLLSDWKWVDEYYSLQIPYPASEVAEINIDPYEGMADVKRENNVLIIAGENTMIINRD